ncbi:MAG: LysM peptidoglycan-binding domain-containing protein [Planctomycetota bacterium]|nr:MAG: LysM peptidoglycan-binding domain-containing protein [Planctomycetota bacterium]
MIRGRNLLRPGFRQYGHVACTSRALERILESGGRPNLKSVRAIASFVREDGSVNSLKPLVIVAVLAGIGYGVYVRLNTGGGTPPVVKPGWDTIPQVQLPEGGSAPWDAAAAPTGPGGEVSAAPPYSQPAPASEAPPYQPPAAANAGQAPPFGGAPADGSGGEAPAHDSAGPPSDAVASMAPPPGANTDTSTDNPYEYLPPHDSGTAPEEAPPAQNNDPYADPYGGSDIPDRYQEPKESTPPEGYSSQSSGGPVPGGPAEYAPATQGPTGEQYAPSEQFPADDPYGAGDYPPGGNAPSETYPDGGQMPAGGGESGVAGALESARRELEGGQLASALRQLSAWYDNPQLSPAEQNELNVLLDQVAGTVVYSTQNLLEPPYEVQPGETLQDIGEKYQVPWQLLAKINGIDDPAALRGGERLKVVRGPFQAVVNLQKRELALMTHDGLYAGRFRIGVGSDQPPQEGTFAVSEKVVNPVYHGRGRALGAEDPTNPLGERWIGLGKQMAIHGTNDPSVIGRENLPGSISLTERDAEDVFDILSLGSRVTIRR